MPSKRIVKARVSTKLPLFDRLSLVLLFVLLLTVVMGGAIRYYALQFHLVWFPYVPRFLLALAIGPMLLARVAREGLTSTYLVLLVLFSVALTYGVFNLGNASQVEFGLWALLPFLYGVVVCESFVRGWKTLKPYAILLWTAAVGGVLINFFHQWPWSGLEYQVGATTVGAGHLWKTGGVDIARLTGFSRSWFEAALQILFLALFLREVLSKRWWVPVWILSGLAITLTTTKTTIVLYLLFCALWVFWHGRITRFWRGLLIFIVCADILAPIVTLFTTVYSMGSRVSSLTTLLVATIVARMELEWPESIHMIWTHGSAIFGRGVGGIGGAQMFFEPALFSPGENIALYLYGIFGILGLAFLLFYAWKSIQLSAVGPVSRFFFLCACAVLLEGFTMSVMEASIFLPMAFGASFWYIQKATARQSVLAPVRPKQQKGPVGSRRPSRPKNLDTLGAPEGSA